MSKVFPAILPILAFLVTACSEPFTTPPSHPLSLRVEHAGCRMIGSNAGMKPPVCQIDGPIHLWVSTAPLVEAEVEVKFGSTHLTSRSAENDQVQPVREGFLFLLEAPTQPSAIEVRAWSGTSEAEWSLDTTPHPPWMAEILALDRAGETQALEERLLSGPPEHQGLTLSRLARLQNFSGENQRFFEYIDRAIDHHHRSKTFSQWLDDVLLKAHGLREAGRFEEAREIVDNLPSVPSSFGKERFQVDYYRGVLAADTGDLRTALRHIGEALDQAERLDQSAWRLMTEQILGEYLQWLGRWSEASDIYAQLGFEGPEALQNPCELSDLYNNIAWLRLLAREAGQDTPDPLPDLQKALNLQLAHCESSSYREENIRLNIALAHFQHGHNFLARQELERAQARTKVAAKHNEPSDTDMATPPLRYLFWSRDLEARLALSEGRYEESLRVFGEVGRLAADTLDPDATWRAALGQAQVYAARGEDEAAIRAFERAERLLDRAVRQVPINAGRDSFIAQRARGTQLFLDHLLESGDLTRAFELARRSRLRGYETFLQPSFGNLLPEDQRQWNRLRRRAAELRAQIDRLAAEAWRVPGDRETLHRSELDDLRQELAEVVDEMSVFLDSSSPTFASENLPALRDEELLLLYHPLPEGWVAFARDPLRLTAQKLDAIHSEASPDVLSDQLLEPFRDQIEATKTVRILTSSALQGIDFHALPWTNADTTGEGRKVETLVAYRAVIYGIDAQPVSPPEHDEMILMVGDPNGDLPQARDEVELIDRSLAERQSTAERLLLLGQEASPGRLRQELARATRFHYAGHGRATEDGWESALPLADDGQLSVNDILALEKVPSRIVLSGCQTGRLANLDGPSKIAGIAQAFLTRGAQSVIAAIRPVEDQTAALLMNLYYKEITAGVSEPEALQRAQRTLHRQSSDVDWASFRLFER